MERYSGPMRDRARTLRRDQTDAEQRIWSRLRSRELADFKFRRQVPVGPFIADFYCDAARLIVEIDGGQHEEGADAERDAWLAERGYRVVRYGNHEVMANLEGVLTDLLSLLTSPHPTLSQGERALERSGADPVSLYRPQEEGLRYEKDPAAIYAQSFATVRAEANLARLPESLHPLAIRVIHACGMVDAADDLAFSDDAAGRGRDALVAGAPILCDCEMVASGIIRRRLPADNEVIVTLNDPRTAMLAQKLKTTRSAAAVVLWRERLEGAVVAIGNAPTALFHLLERLDRGWPKPACILGFPVGFVGAAESKAELARDPRGSAFVAMAGRRGGSAMASAAVNALAGGLE